MTATPMAESSSVGAPKRPAPLPNRLVSNDDAARARRSYAATLDLNVTIP